jgi:hypothetical protein
MNGAYWHIATNHIPVIAMPFIFFLLLGGVLRKSPDLIKASYIASIVVALITIFVWKTGGPAAHVLKNHPEIQVQRADIHEHAEAADFGLWSCEIVGALALIGLWLRRRENRLSWWPWLVVVVSLWSSTVLARVAHLGGLIRHSEISSAPAPTPGDAPPASPSTNHP